MLALCGGAGRAYADLAHGTPLFTCTAPTLNTDGTAIPATGTLALKEFRFYPDGVTTATKVIPATSTCSYQTVSGEYAAGAHTMQVTAVNNAGQESTKSPSTPLPFVVPQPTPAAPGALTVQ